MKYHNVKRGTVNGTVGGTLVNGRPGALKQPIDIEDLLVWAYKVQRIDLVLSAPIPRSSPAAFSSDGYAPGCFGAIRNLTLGATIDTFARVQSPDTPRDAERVHAVVTRLGREQSDLLIVSARSGAPDVYANVRPHLAPIASPRLDRQRNVYPPLVLYSDPGRRVGYCPLRQVPDPDEVDRARFVYASWHEALTVVGATLARMPLDAWHVTGPKRAAAPWSGMPTTTERA